MQPRAVNADLRKRMPRMPAPQLAVHELTETVEKHAFQILDTERLEPLERAQCRQLPACVRQERDPYSDFSKLSYRIKHHRFDAVAVQP